MTIEPLGHPRAQLDPKPNPDAGLTPDELKRLHQGLLAERSRVTSGMDRHVQEATFDTEVLTDELDMASGARSRPT